jgi:hypothetical protein
VGSVADYVQQRLSTVGSKPAKANQAAPAAPKKKTPAPKAKKAPLSKKTSPSKKASPSKKKPAAKKAVTSKKKKR